MKADTENLTQGSLWKKILFFSFPLMLSNVLQVLFNMSDIAVVGQFAGPAALGAVGSTTTLVAMFTSFLIGMGNGVNALVARYFGSDNRREVSDTVHTAVLLCSVMGVVILILGQIGTRPILQLLGTKPELMDGAILYLRIYFLGMPALAIYNFGNGVFSAIGNTRKPLFFLASSGVINVLLNLFLVIVCHLDVAGVAIASVLAQYLSAVLILQALFRTTGCYGLQVRKLQIHKNKAKMILGIGIPAGLQQAIFQAANLFIQAGVNTFDATMVSGNAAAANADALVYDVMAAFYTACGSFLGQNYGAGNKERVRKSYGISLLYSFATGTIMGLLLVLFGHSFLALFTRDAAVAEAGMYRLRIMGLSYGVSAFMDCTISASRGLGKSLIPTIVVILGSCIFRIAWIYTIFAYFRTINSLYLLYIFSWIITAAAEILYFHHIYRQEFQLPEQA